MVDMEAWKRSHTASEDPRTDVLIGASFVSRSLYPFIDAAIAWQNIEFQGTLTRGQAELIRQLGESMLEANQLIASMLEEHQAATHTPPHQTGSEPPQSV